MTRTIPRHGSRHRIIAKGFALIGAIFLLVVIAAFGVAMVRLSGMEHGIPLMGWQSAGAYFAARSGAEWGSVRALALGACPAVPMVLSPVAGLNGGDLDGYKVVVTLENCTTHREAGNTFHIYIISAAAETTRFVYGEVGYAMRSTTATVTDAP